MPQKPRPQSQPQPSQPPRVTAEQLLHTTQSVGKLGLKTKEKVEEVLGLLTAEKPEGMTDPIEDLKQSLDFILGRLTALEDTTQKIFDMLTKQSRAR